LAARPSSQETVALHQKIGHAWWNNDRHRFLLYSSFYVRQEASEGDASVAQRRLEYLRGIVELDIPAGIESLEDDLVRLFQLPSKAATDASHLGMAILHRIDYLLTWNCTHLANAKLQRDLYQYCAYHKLHYPIVCTPEALIHSLP